MTARRHHFIPRCYLKGFTVERKKQRQITVFDGVEKKTFLTSIENVAVERDFNRFEADGVAPDAFENKMAEMESEIATALGSIIEKRSIAGEEDRILLMNFICLLALRNPRFRETMRDFQERVSKRMISMSLRTPEIWNAQTERGKKAGFIDPDSSLSYEEAKEFVARNEYSIEVPTERHIQMELKAFDKALPTFFGRKWSLLRASSSSAGFITSDHPVILAFVDPKMGGGVYSPGFGLSGTEVTFPISSHLAVAGTFETKAGVYDVDENFVAAVNGGQVIYSERQIYARDSNFHYTVVLDQPPRKASKLIDDKHFRKTAL
ncbi:MAG: DUF4238 domain-containing protein [Aestuariivirga sp.]